MRVHVYVYELYWVPGLHLGQALIAHGLARGSCVLKHCMFEKSDSWDETRRATNRYPTKGQVSNIWKFWFKPYGIFLYLLPMFKRFGTLGWIRTDLTLPIAIGIRCLWLFVEFLQFQRECVMNIDFDAYWQRADACINMMYTDAWRIHMNVYACI